MRNLKEYIKWIFLKVPAAVMLLDKINNARFPGSGRYWDNHYKSGGNSGAGSYNRLAQFKADIINDFIKENNIKSALEFGCGDGNNLALVKYPAYIGLDVSAFIIKQCAEKFKSDNSKKFYVYNPFAFENEHPPITAELSLSLDVIYHLVEDSIYEKYMLDLFKTSQKYVIIYSRNYTEKWKYHQRSRKFTDWVDKNQKSFNLIKTVKNPYPYSADNPENTSNAEFFIYERISSL